MVLSSEVVLAEVLMDFMQIVTQLTTQGNLYEPFWNFLCIVLYS